jgi:hypothetical protein
MLAALLTFQDQSEEIHNGNNSGAPVPTGRNPSGETNQAKPGAEIVEQVQVKAGVCIFPAPNPFFRSDQISGAPERSYGRRARSD